MRSTGGNLASGQDEVGEHAAVVGAGDRDRAGRGDAHAAVGEHVVDRHERRQRRLVGRPGHLQPDAGLLGGVVVAAADQVGAARRGRAWR